MTKATIHSPVRSIIVEQVQSPSKSRTWSAQYYSPLEKRMVHAPGVEVSRAAAIATAQRCIDEESTSLAIANRFGALISELRSQGYSNSVIMNGFAECCYKDSALEPITSLMEDAVLSLQESEGRTGRDNIEAALAFLAHRIAAIEVIQGCVPLAPST